jgi:hypothetical protein
MPAEREPNATARKADTLPRPVPAQAKAAPSVVPSWLAAALFVMVMSAIVVLALRGAR